MLNVILWRISRDLLFRCLSIDICSWPSLNATLEDGNGRLMGYILGKAEGHKNLWHGHVTAVTVAPEYRKLGCAKTLMNYLERGTEEVYNGYFVDLFVRESNSLAQLMYKNLGYTVYRRVLGYYSGEEDAYGIVVGGLKVLCDMYFMDWCL